MVELRYDGSSNSNGTNGQDNNAAYAIVAVTAVGAGLYAAFLFRDQILAAFGIGPRKVPTALTLTVDDQTGQLNVLVGSTVNIGIVLVRADTGQGLSQRPVRIGVETRVFDVTTDINGRANLALLIDSEPSSGFMDTVAEFSAGTSEFASARSNTVRMNVSTPFSGNVDIVVDITPVFQANPTLSAPTVTVQLGTVIVQAVPSPTPIPLLWIARFLNLPFGTYNGRVVMDGTMPAGTINCQLPIQIGHSSGAPVHTIDVPASVCAITAPIGGMKPIQQEQPKPVEQVVHQYAPLRLPGQIRLM